MVIVYTVTAKDKKDSLTKNFSWSTKRKDAISETVEEFRQLFDQNAICQISLKECK